MTPAPDARLNQWRDVRAARLSALPWLHTDTSTSPSSRYLKDELLVGAGHEQAAAEVLRGLGVPAGQISVTPAVLGFQRVTAPGVDVAAAARTLRDHLGEGAAGPHHIFLSSPFEVGGPYGPPSSAGSYQLSSGPAADAAVRVAVVDTGIWRDSPLPPSWYEAGHGDYDDTQAAEADTGHANFITGVVMAGTDNAKIRVVKVLDADGVCREADLAAALAGLDDVDVVNLSLGAFSLDDHPPVLLQAALAAVLENRDRAVVAAAGNEGVSGRPYWPAAFAGTKLPFAEQVVAVAAHDGAQLCQWSNTGPWVDMSAPGSDIVSTYVKNADFPAGFACWSGTSFAAPFVAAAIAGRQPAAGTIRGAVAEVRKAAEARSYGGYPALA